MRPRPVYAATYPGIMTFLFEPTINNRRAEVSLSPNDIRSAAPNQIRKYSRRIAAVRPKSYTYTPPSQQPQTYVRHRLDSSHMNDTLYLGFM